MRNHAKPCESRRMSVSAATGGPNSHTHTNVCSVSFVIMLGHWQNNNWRYIHTYYDVHNRDVNDGRKVIKVTQCLAAGSFGRHASCWLPLKNNQRGCYEQLLWKRKDFAGTIKNDRLGNHRIMLEYIVWEIFGWVVSSYTSHPWWYDA